MSETLRVRCPDCESELVVDRATGEVLSHTAAEREPAGGRSFESLLQEQDESRSRAEDIFEREKASLEDRDRLMEEKFRRALEKVDDSDEAPPPRPFDLD